MYVTLVLSLVVHLANGLTSWAVDSRRTLHRFNETNLTTMLQNASNKTKIRSGNGTGVCKDNPCSNGGSCVINHNYVDGYHCECTPEYKGIRCKELLCKVSILKDTSSKCRVKRAIDIHKRKKAFMLALEDSIFSRTSKLPTLDIPQMAVHSHKAFIKEASTSPFTIDWYMKMQQTVNSNSQSQNHFTLMDKNFHALPTLKDFSAIYEYFYRQHRTQSAMSVLRQTPSVEANFFKDREFVDQRFAGANVWQIHRVTKDGNGLNWMNLQGKLNGHFNWNEAVNGILGTKDDNALETAIEENKLFVSWYPELEGVALDKGQLPDHHFPNSTAVRLTAPITMFVMKENGDSEDLEVVAIQADSIPEARVFTSSDGKEWFFAKSLVQRADFNVLQVVHKRLKAHLYMEPFCLLMERSFSEFNPIYDMLQYHCRATLETNKLYDMKLYGPGGPFYSLLSMGYSTSVEIINKNYHEMDFDNIDLETDLKKRGLDDASILPYFPYRDDARLIVKTIVSFVDRYVDLYYDSDEEVRSDRELQQWADLLSVDGNKTATSRGLVKNFPRKLETRQVLKTVLERLLWLATGYHASVTFPQLEYGSFLPNAPYRIFADGENNAVFSIKMFGNKIKALDQVEFTANIASSHVDKLFDYGHKLQDKKGQKLLDDVVTKDLLDATKKMAFANAMRVKSGHLPYPYLLPDFITNSIST